jgi:UDP-2-acetamido-2-deoxy-ribo-hexuluronate aminotransferase
VNILLSPEVVVDACTQGEHTAAALGAVEKCVELGGKVWLYAGSVTSLETGMVNALAGAAVELEAARKTAKTRLAEFAKGKQWLAALAGEGDVFAANNPGHQQLLLALRRFGEGAVVLLTRDAELLANGGAQSLTPAQFLSASVKHVPMEFIDLKAQQNALRPELELNIHRVLHHGQYILGAEVKLLEEKLAAYTGSKHCITCASGTEALLMSLMALGIGPGDEVITSPFTFAATAEMIVLVGATPVFVDIEPDTCLINAELIEAKITSRTKAIMPVSLYGQVADMNAINALAAKHGNIPVIEDAAQSFGASYWGFKQDANYESGKTHKSCNLSTIGCTSFFPSKPLGCYGDGGAIFTNDDALAQAMREIRVHGQSKRYHHTRVGVGGRMDTLQCAIVLAKLERFDWEIEQRKQLGALYSDMLRTSPTVKLLSVRKDRDCVWAQYTVFTENRSELQEHLKARGIPTAVHYPVPINLQPAYQHLCCPDCVPLSESAGKSVMSLPLSADSSHDQLTYVVKNLGDHR